MKATLLTGLAVAALVLMTASSVYAKGGGGHGGGHHSGGHRSSHVGGHHSSHHFGSHLGSHRGGGSDDLRILNSTGQVRGGEFEIRGRRGEAEVRGRAGEAALGLED